jgi:3-hydroxybutyryl-CoA dehydrogenase
LSFFLQIWKAVANADLVIESVPEDPSIKKDFIKASSCSSRKPFSLVSSTMPLASLPNQQVDQLNLQLHFANEIWKHNTAEIMGHPGTNADVFDTLVAFANLSEW